MIEMTREEKQKKMEEVFGPNRDYFDLNILHELAKTFAENCYIYVEAIAGEADYYEGYSLSDIEQAVMASAETRVDAIIKYIIRFMPEQPEPVLVREITPEQYLAHLDIIEKELTEVLGNNLLTEDELRHRLSIILDTQARLKKKFEPKHIRVE